MEIIRSNTVPMTVFLQKEEELKSLKDQYYSLTGQYNQFHQESTPWQFSTMQKIPQVSQALPFPQSGGTSILRLKEIIDEEERKRKKKGKAKEEAK